jgi:1-deoxy-D-xylulose 5-phosphate reductoisomerase
MKKRGVAILGSTGSIGKQALEVIQAHADHFSAQVLTADQNANIQAFLDLKIGFLQIGGINEKVMRASNFVQSPVYEDYLAVDKEARDLAALIVMLS